LRRQGRLDAALEVLESIPPVSDLQQREVALERAAIWRLQGRLEAAQRLVREILDNAPRQRRALLEWAALARQQGDNLAALERYQELQRLHPDFGEPQLPLAAVLRELGRLPEAREAIERFLSSEPNHPWGLMERAAISRGLQCPEAALSDYLLLLEHQADFQPAKIQAAHLAIELGRLDQAETLLDSSLRADPTNQKLLRQRGRLAEQRQAGSGRAWLAVANRPEQPEPYLSLIDRLVETGDLEAAAALVDRAQERFPDHMGFPLRKAQLQWLQGDLEAALARMETLAEEFPGDFTIWIRLANWRAALGYRERVEQMIATAQLPGSEVRGSEVRGSQVRGSEVRGPEVQGRIAALRGRIAWSGWDTQGALRGYGEATKKLPDDAGYHRQLALLFSLTLDLEQAHRHLQRADAARSGGSGKLRGFLASWINEFSVNPVGLGLLREAMEAQAGDRIPALAQVVRSEPDYTPAAVLLLLALRNRGYLETMGRACGKEGAWPLRIPRRILQYREQEEMSERDAEVAASWRRHSPQFDYQPFCAQEARGFLHSHFEPAVAAAFQRCHTPAMRAGLLLLAYLYLHGGVYCHATDLCRHPIEGLGREGAELLLYQEERGSIGNRFIAAVPGHPLLGRALDRAVSELLATPRCDPWFTTGPGLISRTAADLLLPALRIKGDAGLVPPWVVLERSQLLRFISFRG